MEIGKKIKELRIQKGLTQNELAERLYVSYQAVSQWENNITTPDINTIIELANQFELSLDELFELKKYNKNNTKQVKIKDANDSDLYILLVRGNTLKEVIDYKEYIQHNDVLKVEYDETINNIYSHFSITVKKDVHQSVYAGDSVVCGNVDNGVNAGDSITCGNINGAVNAGDSITCGNIIGDINAGDIVTCGNVSGDIFADKVTAVEVKGNIKADLVEIISKEKEK